MTFVPEKPAGWGSRRVDETVVCPPCGDTGWIETAPATPEATTFVRPCERCRTKVHRKWQQGGFRALNGATRRNDQDDENKGSGTSGPSSGYRGSERRW